jgi:glutathione synthase/RimK-type ligase-like ATP-grasp enzyme
MSRFIGITREHVFSPGRVGDDGAILNDVADCLRERGHEVVVVGGDDEQWPDAANACAVFAMCQGPRALARLQHWRAQGLRIVNTPEAILNCQRHRTVAALSGSGIPFPDSVLVPAAAAPQLPAWVERAGAWIKRGDVHATQADDVIFARDGTAARQALRSLQQREIATALVQRHVPGTVLKFYGVRQRFFRCLRPKDFELTPAVLERIGILAERAAHILELEIFGGDCILGDGGELVLIDLNDWPSYAACRAEAAEEIAGYLVARDTTTAT